MEKEPVRKQEMSPDEDVLDAKAILEDNSSQQKLYKQFRDCNGDFENIKIMIECVLPNPKCL
ncbi:unnamed protein product [Albugo candida]|uniref:Uncharacterized protein n=1 Tax=Albugo candida TaxID=65357 RepID=A0A024GV71_9STRA|nr:unnamed protein product [Albugo candida]|eukprot:CCI50468.1 unnamed protein product [Albugo candida]